MSTNLSLLAALTLLAACRPAFEAVDPELCAGARPTSSCGPGCRLVRHETPLLPRALNDTPREFTREVSARGWTAVSPNPTGPAIGARPSVGTTSPLTLDEVLGAAGDEVLFKAGPAIASLDAATGEVSHVVTTTGLPYRWAAGPAGGFFVVSGRQVAPSNPKYGARVVVLPTAQPLVAASARSPLPTDVTSGVIFIPTSSGLFAFQPAALAPLTLLAAGTFTSVAILGGELYASRCEAMPDTPGSRLQATAVVPLTSRCDIVRAPLGSNAFVPIATLTGIVELLPRGDRLLARSPFELTSLTREGEQVLLYALPHPDSTSLKQARVIGPLVGTSAQPAFESGVCVVTLDETRGTTVRDLEDPLELVTGVVRFTARPAP